MQFEISPFAILLGISGLVSIFIAAYAWVRRSGAAGLALALMALLIAEWSFTYALELASPDLAGKYFWGKLQYIGIAGVPLMWVLFAFMHTQPGKPLAVGRLVALSFIPGVTIALALTMEWHGLIWGDVEILREANFAILSVLSRGFWFWVHFAYSYLLLLAGSVIIVRWLLQSPGIYRGQAVALIFALVAPWFGNILYFAGVNPDPTPFAFTITLLGLLWAIFGYRLVDVAPLARDLVVEGLREGLIVLDMKGNVVDINAAAARLIGLAASQAIGKPVLEVLQPWRTMAQSFRNVLEADETVEVGEGEARRQLNLRISPLRDRQKNIVGRLVTFWEISAEPARPAIRLQEPLTEPIAHLPELHTTPEPAKQNRIWRTIRAFFAPSVIKLAAEKNENLIWKQTIERSFTIIMRAIAPLGSLALLAFILVSSQNGSSLFDTILSSFILIQILIFTIIWLLALMRSWQFSFRVGLFLFLIYALTFNEVLNYGYSAEGFAFLMAFVALAGLMSNWRGSLWALAIGLATMAMFGLLFGSQIIHPLSDPMARPTSISDAIPGLAALSAAAIGMMAAVNTLMSSLNRSWQQETQTRNLLQQERDLLEKRVSERTYSLAEAKDEAVKVSNELRKYYTTIEQSGSTIVITNKDGTIEYVNPRFETLTGYSTNEATGQNPRILQSGEHPPEFYAQMWHTIKSGETWRGEIQNKRKDGSLFWESAVITPVFSTQGEITNYVAIKEDITAQKELREEINRQNEYLSILQQMTIDLLNRRELPDLLNAIVERISKLLNVPVSGIMLEEDEHLVLRAFTKSPRYQLGEKIARGQSKLPWQAYDTQKPVVTENYLPIASNPEIYESNPVYAVACFPILSGNNCVGVLTAARTQPDYPFTSDQVEIGVQFARMVALVLDNANLYNSALKEIEQRKLAEEQNLRFLEDMKSLQEISLTLSQVETLDELYVQMIDMAQRRLGLDRVGLFVVDENSNELVGTFGVDPSGMVRDERYYREPITEDHWTLEIVQAHNHAKLWTDAPLYDDTKVVGHGWKTATALWNGYQPIGYLVSDTFLTHRPARPYETELISLLGNTYGHMIERKRVEQQLAIARDQALEASRFKSQLLAKVSHELRTPLGSVIGYAELLQYNILGDITPEQRDAVEKIVESGNYLTGIVNELLDESQIESKSIKLNISTFSPVELVERVKISMEVLAHNKKLSLESFIDPNATQSVYGDEKRTQQILINLTGNAIKFTMSGGVRLELFCPDPAHWAIRVIDTGAGIPKEAQGYIFEPFRQVDNAITNQNRGTGLGLSITRQLVELMGGTIELESEVGKGSTFTVTLPIMMKAE